MPVITIEMHKTDRQIRSNLIQGLTKTAAEITTLPQQSFIVLIHEMDDANIGIGGKPRDEWLK